MLNGEEIFKSSSGKKFSYYDSLGKGTFTRVRIPVKGVSLNKKSVRVYKGKTYALTAVLDPSNATNQKLSWSSSNKKIATVTSTGVVKGLKAGTAIITVKSKDGAKTAKCKVVVK